MDKCSTCRLKYTCKDNEEFDCINNNYCFYIGDEKMRSKSYHSDFWKEFTELNKNVEKVDYVSDGDHTFKELYFHRMILFSIICNQNKEKAWKSWNHYDGTMYDDYFIVGIGDENGYFSYHYHKNYWSNFDVKELSHAPKWSPEINKQISELEELLKGE